MSQQYRRNIFQRILGIPATSVPVDPECWSYSDGRVIIDLEKAPELAEPGGAVRIEGDILPDRLMVFRGDDGEFYAFSNRCSHAGRKMDPVPGSGTVMCCSVSRSTYDYRGAILSGPVKKNARVYPAEAEGGRLTITLV